MKINIEIKKKHMLMQFALLMLITAAISVYSLAGQSHATSEIDWNTALPKTAINSIMANAFPPGAIMAFDRIACPEGWIELTTARGRVVAGYDPVNQYTNTIGKQGGAYTVALSQQHLPSHTHGVNDPTHSHDTNIYVTQSGYTNGAQTFGNGGARGYLTSGGKTGITIRAAGGSQAHDNVQPYVAYLYCKKT